MLVQGVNSFQQDMRVGLRQDRPDERPRGARSKQQREWAEHRRPLLWSVLLFGGCVLLGWLFTREDAAAASAASGSSGSSGSSVLRRLGELQRLETRRAGGLVKQHRGKLVHVRQVRETERGR